MKTMKKNEVADYLITSDYNMGDTGCPPRVPGGETSMCHPTLKNKLKNYMRALVSKLTLFIPCPRS